MFFLKIPTSMEQFYFLEGERQAKGFRACSALELL